MIHSPTDALTAQPELKDDTQTGPANRIRTLQAFGQSVWLDYLRRSLFTSGEFERLITEDGLRGATSNPSIFEKAIAGSTDYLSALHDIEQRGDMSPMALYEALAIRDIRDAAAVKEALKEKLITQDDEKKAEVDIQKLTDKYVADIDAQVAAKEKEIMQV